MNENYPKKMGNKLIPYGIILLALALLVVLYKCDSITINKQKIHIFKSDLPVINVARINTVPNQHTRDSLDGTTLFEATIVTKSGTVLIPAYTYFSQVELVGMFEADSVKFVFDMQEITHDLKFDKIELPARLDTLTIDARGEIKGFSVKDGDEQEIEFDELLFKTSTFSCDRYYISDIDIYKGRRLRHTFTSTRILGYDMPVISFSNGIKISFVSKAAEGRYRLVADTQSGKSKWALYSRNGHFLVSRKKYGEEAILEHLIFDKYQEKIISYIKNGEKTELPKTPQYSNTKEEIADLFLRK